jgi:hypothetical protein
MINDNVNFITIDLASAVTSYQPSADVLANLKGFKYIKLSSVAAGVAGDKVTLILTASR